MSTDQLELKVTGFITKTYLVFEVPEDAKKFTMWVGDSKVIDLKPQEKDYTKVFEKQ